MVGVTHFRNKYFGVSFADSTGAEWHGLSSEGRKLVTEANLLGIALGASHALDAASDQLIDQSATPVLLSHSGCKASDPAGLAPARPRPPASSASGRRSWRATRVSSAASTSSLCTCSTV